MAKIRVYCWAIKAADQPCCGRSGSTVLEFGSQLDSFYTCVLDNMYVELKKSELCRILQNVTIAWVGECRWISLKLSFFCRIHPVVVYHIKTWYTYRRQPQQISLAPSTHATYFGRSDRLQVLTTWYFKLKIKWILHFM
jgi:hypothetical protein